MSIQIIRENLCNRCLKNPLKPGRMFCEQCCNSVYQNRKDADTFDSKIDMMLDFCHALEYELKELRRYGENKTK